MQLLSPNDERYIVKLDIFEGPLDLLLHLIRKHELDIFDIPISFITSKYLEYLDMMKRLNLDLASDYLDMAATLALIKSRMMLPRQEAEDDENPEEGPDPREELVRRLLEYQKYKTAAGNLLELPMLGRDTFDRGSQEVIAVERELAAPGLFALVEAFYKVLKDADPEPVHQVEMTTVSLTQRIKEMVSILRRRSKLTFDDLFEGQRTRGDIVVTFLSVLELAKLGMMVIYQAGTHSQIHIDAGDELDEAEEILAKRFLED